MAIILDEENKIVTVENQPDAPRAMFKNLPEASTIESGVGDVLINGVSIVDENGNADIPKAVTNRLGVVMPSNDGIQTNASGQIFIQEAISNEIKQGASDKRPIVPYYQHEASFYGMAKAAGDTTQALSDNAVGNYTDEAKIAIQKMLGIYDAPWEVINDGTFTNETEADYTINTDSNNQPFELTDVRVVFSLPQQESEASKGDYGRIRISGSLVNVNIFLRSWTQAAGDTSKGGYGLVEQKGNMLTTWFTSNAAEGSDVNIRGSYWSTGPASQYFQLLNGTNIITSITITSVKGTGKYTIYGRRKWQ